MPRRKRPQALDLFCGAGGASMGLRRAGFDVTGIDIRPQPHYPFRFWCGDALHLARDQLAAFDLVWASPPCQAFTAYKRRPNHVVDRDNLIPSVREMLLRYADKWVIENIPGAPLRNPITLCGSMFGLDVRRHRLFETNFPLIEPRCQHDRQTPRFPQATNRKNKRCTVEIGVWRIPLDVQRRAMGIDWMGIKELSQSVPPAYAEYIGRSAINAKT